MQEYRVTPYRAPELIDAILDKIENVQLHVKVGVYVTNILTEQQFVKELTIDRIDLDRDCTPEIIHEALNLTLQEHFILLESSGLIVNVETFAYYLITPIERANLHDPEDEVSQRSSIGSSYNDEENLPKIRKVANASKGWIRALYYAVMDKHKRGREKDYNQWVVMLEERGIDTDVEVSMTNIISWLRENIIAPALTIRIFTNYGNVVYERKGNEENSEIRYMQYDTQTRTWRYIYNLNGFLKLRKDRQTKFCDKCRSIHKNGKCMWAKPKLQDIDEDDRKGRMRHLPEGQYQNLIYADTEAYIDKHTGKHNLSHIGAVFIKHGSYSAYKEWNIRDFNDSAIEMMRDWQMYIVNHYGMELEKEIEWYEKDQKYKTDCATCGRNNRDKYYASCWSYLHDERKEGCWNCMELLTKIPIYFHNLSGYDLHHIISPLMSNRDRPVESYNFNRIISKGLQKWEAFSMTFVHHDGDENMTQEPYSEGYGLSFKDSFLMLSGSIDGLAKDRLKDNEPLLFTKREDFAKAPFPYDYYDSLEKLDQPLPEDKELWWNKLTNSYGDMDTALAIARDKGLTTLGMYLRYYMKLDVKVMAEVFELYRKQVNTIVGYDMSCFHGTPSIAIYYAKQVADRNGMLEDGFSATSADLQKMFWAQIRGGICNAIVQYKDVKIHGGSIEYLDVAGLYATAMKMKFPIGDSISEVLDDDLYQIYLDTMEMDVDGDHGYFYLVDWEYPEEFHDRDLFLPLIESKYVTGLMNSFEPIKAQLHHQTRMKQLYEAGLRPTKVHQMWEFEQIPLFKEFIESNLANRQKALDAGQEIMQLIFKLFSNSAYGKTMQNPSKFGTIFGMTDEWMVENGHGARQATPLHVEGQDPTWLVAFPFEGINRGTPHIGFTILEHSKTIFYGFWHRLNEKYNGHVMKPLSLCYCDTDSMILHSDFPNLWETLVEDFPDLVNDTKQKILGTWEREIPNIEAVICLSAKQYFVKTPTKSIVKHKGVSKRINLTWDDYYDVMKLQTVKMIEQVQFKKVAFGIKTIPVQKRGLSYQNNKRILVYKTGLSLPFGYSGTLHRPVYNLLRAQAEQREWDEISQ